MADDHTATSQPTQSDAVVKLLETMRERCTHPCRSEKAELGCDCDAARQAAVMLRQPTQSDALREALVDLLHAVCGENGFAQAVRWDSGRIYPWPALDLAEAKARAALEQSK